MSNPTILHFHPPPLIPKLSNYLRYVHSDIPLSVIQYDTRVFLSPQSTPHTHPFILRLDTCKSEKHHIILRIPTVLAPRGIPQIFDQQFYFDRDSYEKGALTIATAATQLNTTLKNKKKGGKEEGNNI